MDFSALSQYLDRLTPDRVPGVDLEIRMGYEPIYRHAAGTGREGRPVRGDEIYWLYSATKVFTATAAMQMYERGAYTLDTPVAEFLPEYAHLTVRDGDTVRPARTVMTVGHLLTMQGGLDYELGAPEIAKARAALGRNGSTRDMVAAFATRPLSFDPGTHFQYSLCHDVLAAVIEQASGLKYEEYLKKNIFGPLGIKSMTMHPTDAHFSRMPARYAWQPEEARCKPIEIFHNDYRLTDAYESGGAGLVGSLDDYIRLPEALANGGVGRTGERILDEGTIALMRTDQLSGASKADFDAMGRTGYSYACGVRTMVDNTYAKSPLGEFGWDSAAGAWIVVDAERKLSAVFMMHVLSCGPAYDEYHPSIRDLIYEGIDAGQGR